MPPILFISNLKTVELKPTFYAKILVLGDVAVGKTSLVSNLCYGISHGTTKLPKLHNCCKKEINKQECNIQMHIFDTGGNTYI